PLEESASPASLRRTLLPSPRIRGLGLQNLRFRGHLCVHLRYGPVTHSPPQRRLRRWASARRSPSALPSGLRGFWLLPRRDCLPLNTSAFSGRTDSSAFERSWRRARAFEAATRDFPCDTEHWTGESR